MDFYWRSSGRVHPSRRTGRTRGRSDLAAWIESLENRTLLSVQVGPITVVAGQTFNGQVATFGPNDLQGNITNFQATINWGGGLNIVTPGIITQLASGGYAVTGSNTYPVFGPYTVNVGLEGLNGSNASGMGTATVLDAPLSSIGQTFPAVKQSSFVGVVAQFQSQNPYAVSSNFAATIAWGDGLQSAGVIAPNASGGFNVVGSHTYANYGSFPTQITITSVGGTQSTIAIGQAVVNAQPISLFATNLSAIAHAPITNAEAANFYSSDPSDSASNFTAVVNWSDGVISPGTVQAAVGGVFNVLVSRNPGYAATGDYSYTVQVTRTATGQQASATGQALISAAPSPLTPLPALIVPTVGTSFTGTVGSLIDSLGGAVAGDLSAVILWGDGKSSAGTVTSSVNPGEFDVSGTHTYTSTGQYAPQVVVLDNLGHSTTIQSMAVVVGTAGALTPVSALILASPGTVYQGPVGSFFDTFPNSAQATFTGVIAWGDGHTSAATIIADPNLAGHFLISGTNTYTTAGTDSVTIQLQDNSGNALAFTSTAVVTGPTIIATGTTFPETPGQLLPATTVVANFTDSNLAATMNNIVATIAWGDGSTSIGKVTQNPTSLVYTVTAGPSGHTYIGSPTNGVYHVTVTIADPSGQTAAANSTAIPAGLIFQPIASLLTFTTGVQGPLPIPPNTTPPPIGSFLYTGPATLPSQFTATITWGDKSTSVGTVTESTVTSGLYYVTATHLYTIAGNYSPTILVQDNAGNSATITSSATVVGPAIIATGTTFTETPGQPVPNDTVVASFTDSNPNATASNLVVTINWGDGYTSTVTPSLNPTTNVYTVTAGPPGHTYIGSPTNGVYHVTVTITDPSGQTATASSDAVVAGPVFQPIGSLLNFTTGVVGPIPTPPNAPTPPVGSFLYTGPATLPSQFTATITWGDGSTSVGTVTESQATPGLYDVTATHLYVTAGNYSPTILVQDNAGNSVKITSSASVVGPAIIATGTTFTETPGQLLPADTVIAHFTDTSGAAAGTISVTINWGDGYTTTGLANPPIGGTYSVTGSHTYFSSSSSFPVTVTIVDPSGQKATASSTALAAGPVFQPIATQVLFTADVAGPDAIGGTMPPIGSFDYNGTTSAFVASINWGNGNTSAGTVRVSTSNPSIYNVYGTNLYVAPGTYSPSIQVSDQNGQTITITSTAVVNSNAALVFSGGLAPIPGNGPGAASGYTNTNRPTFSGTAPPFSTVQLFARPAVADVNEPLGIAVASGSGQWTLATGPLADGIYNVSAVVTPPAGYPSAPQVLGTTGNFVVDTVDPQVASVVFNSASQVTVLFRDDLSGMNVASLTQTGNYVFAGPRLRGVHPSVATVVSGGLPAGVQEVVLSLPRGRRNRELIRGVSISGTSQGSNASSGITDNAGNPLLGFSQGLLNFARARTIGKHKRG